MSIVKVDGLVPELKKLGEKFGKKFEAFFSVHGWKANTNKCRGKVQQGSECCACLHGLLFNYLYSEVSTFFFVWKCMKKTEDGGLKLTLYGLQ